MNIHPTACVDPTADIHPTAIIGPYAKVGAGATVRTGATVAPSAKVPPDAVIDAYEWYGDSEYDLAVTLEHQPAKYRDPTQYLAHSPATILDIDPLDI